MTNVGTVNPTLTFLLVMLFLGMVAAIAALASLLHRAKAGLRASQRVAGKHKAALRRASEAEEQATRLMAGLESALATARQAVSNTEQLETVSAQLGQLFSYVTAPIGEAGRGPQASLPEGPDLTGPYPEGYYG